MSRRARGSVEPPRRQMLAAAIDCFARHGYRGTSIERIARDVGVTKGARFYHFRDKEDLLFAAVTERVGEFERKVLRDAEPARDALTTLRRVVDACFFHATVSNPRRFIITLRVEALDTSPRLSEEFRRILRGMRSYLAEVVRRGQRAGSIRADVAPAAVAATIAGGIMGAEIQHYQDPEQVDLRAVLDTLVEQLPDWLPAPRPRGGPPAARARPAQGGGEAGGLRRRHAMVNFSPTEDQELLRQTLVDFAREVLRPQLRESDEKGTGPADLTAKAWELGLVQESIPESVGGFGGTRSAVSGTLVLEELAYGGLALGLHFLSPRLVTVPLLLSGTEAQRAQWLPKFAGAEFTAGTAAVVEPRWDFDAAHPATRAERDGGDWLGGGAACV